MAETTSPSSIPASAKLPKACRTSPVDVTRAPEPAAGKAKAAAVYEHAVSETVGPQQLITDEDYPNVKTLLASPDVQVADAAPQCRLCHTT